MKPLFNKIGLAITFSPTGKALLAETKRLKELFGSKLVLIHAGENTPAVRNLLTDTIIAAGIDTDKVELISARGEPANVILQQSKKAGIDLLVAGALEKERLFKYYIGSVARKIMREASSSTLILKSPSENPVPYKKFYVSTDFSPESENTIRTAYLFAMLENADEFFIVRDYSIPGLASTVLESGSMDELEDQKEQWQQEEEAKMRLFVRELNLKGPGVKTICIYGKEGWESGNLARRNNADIFAVTAPLKKLKFLDRLFHHDLEYSFENLPANLLIIR